MSIKFLTKLVFFDPQKQNVNFGGPKKKSCAFFDAQNKSKKDCFFDSNKIYFSLVNRERWV